MVAAACLETRLRHRLVCPTATAQLKGCQRPTLEPQINACGCMFFLVPSCHFRRVSWLRRSKTRNATDATEGHTTPRNLARLVPQRQRREERSWGEHTEGATLLRTLPVHVQPAASRWTRDGRGPQLGVSPRHRIRGEKETETQEKAGMETEIGGERSETGSETRAMEGVGERG